MQDEEIRNRIDVTLLNPDFEIYKVKLTPEFLQKMGSEKITPPCNLNDVQSKIKDRPFAICVKNEKDFTSIKEIMNKPKGDDQQEKLESFLLSLNENNLLGKDPSFISNLFAKKNQVDKNKHKMYKTEETGYDNPAFERD